MNILIIGGAGFIGSHIAERYQKLGHQVIIVDSLVSGKKENIPDDARFINMDIRDRRLEDIFRQYQIDAVNHHAAQMNVRKSVSNPGWDADINIIGSLNVMRCAVQSQVKKFIFSSSGGTVYGEQDYFPADENHPRRPLCPYGVAKLAVENYLYYFYKNNGMSYVILRYANVYGARQNPFGEAGVVAIFIDHYLRGLSPTINGDGKQTRDYVHVSDVVQANELALLKVDRDILNVGTGKETTVLEINEKILLHLKSSIRETFGPAKKGEQKRSVLDICRFQSRYGWNPRVLLSDGLKNTIGYFINKV